MTELRLEVDGDGVEGVALDRLCRQLAADLRSIGGLAVHPASADAVEGTKSPSAHEIGALLVTGLFSVSTARAVKDVIVAYLDRSRARAVTVRRGDAEITITGASAAELRTVADRLESILGVDETK